MVPAMVVSNVYGFGYRRLHLRVPDGWIIPHNFKHSNKDGVSQGERSFPGCIWNKAAWGASFILRG